MMDLTSQKILVPAALFALLSPGLLLSLPSKNIGSMATGTLPVLIHALVLVLVYWALTKARVVKNSLTQADLLVPALLFVLLSPGMLLTLPPKGGIWMTKTTSLPAIAVHTVVFMVAFALLRQKFPQVY